MIVKEYSELDKRLIAFYTTKLDISGGEIREYLKDKLPAYMIPNQLILKSELPLTLNGKIDKKKLKSELDIPKESLMNKVDNSTFEKLSGIWKELFRY